VTVNILLRDEWGGEDNEGEAEWNPAKADNTDDVVLEFTIVNNKGKTPL
jgi:hypothetical protein